MEVVRFLFLFLVLLSQPAWGQEDKPLENPPRQSQQEKCRRLSEEERRKTEACKTDEERRQDDYERRQKEAEKNERISRTSFLKWMHVDSLWVPTVLGSSTVGIIGTHLAVANLGRVYFYGPPGVMLLLEDTGTSRRVRPGLTWGISVYLTDFRFPGTSRDAQLFLNLARCWTFGDAQTGLDMGGLSVTWKK